MKNFPLTIELVPKTCWYSNVRSNVSIQEWDKIRKKCYSIANNKCEVCGDNGRNQGVKHFVECHEIWKYNDEKKEQILIGLIALCPYCHKTKHVGLAQMKGEINIVINQLMKVNKMTKSEALNYIRECFDIWGIRSMYQWTLNIDFLMTYF